MDLNLEGKTAVITGASRGIGRAVADALAAEHCDVHLVARNRESLKLAQTELNKTTSVRVEVHALDLATAEGQHTLVELCGDADIQINNAGAIPRGDLLSIDENGWRKAWELKLFGYINLTRLFYARMKARRAGVIINIIGVGGERPTSPYIAGATANAGLIAFTQALGGEAPDHGVRVLGVNPGLVATDRMVELLSADARARLGDGNRWRELLTDRPFGRAAEPREIADVVTFLASERASYISGSIVTVDGGSTTRQPPI